MRNDWINWLIILIMLICLVVIVYYLFFAPPQRQCITLEESYKLSPDMRNAYANAGLICELENLTLVKKEKGNNP